MKWIVYILFIVAFLLITVFGLGPALLADGSDLERFLTLAVVILLYLILILLFVLFVKRKNN